MTNLFNFHNQLVALDNPEHFVTLTHYKWYMISYVLVKHMVL